MFKNGHFTQITQLKRDLGSLNIFQAKNHDKMFSIESGPCGVGDPLHDGLVDEDDSADEAPDDDQHPQQPLPFRLGPVWNAYKDGI